jgi:hypothetical protein
VSKLRLNGTSSGYVEIAAPATGANNTITLPSTTGSIIVQSTTGITSFASAPVVIGAGASTGTASQMLQVTGGAYVSGDVGIGTASPQFKLDVFGTYSRFRTTSSFNGIQIVSSSITDIKWTDTTNDRGWIWSNRGDGAFALITENPSASFSEKLRITSDGSFSITQTPGKYTVDTTGGATSIANNGTVDFSNASGMLVVNNHSNGAVTIYLCGGGSTLAASSVIAQVGTLTYVVGINGYRFTNTYGSAATFGFFFVRTRTNA